VYDTLLVWIRGGINMRRLSILAVAAFVLSLAAVGARAQTIGSIVIDDATDTLTISLDGTDVTGLLVPGPLPPNQTVGTLTLTNGLISTGPGCNNPGGTGECALLGWDDPNVFTSLASGTSYFSPVIRLLESPGVVSDLVSLEIVGRGELGTQFTVSLRSDSESGFVFDCASSSTGCHDLLETGGFQDLTSLLLTPVNSCIVCNLPTGVNDINVSVRSDVEAAVPEPATLALLGLGLAGLGFSRRKSH
jgi:PEP-CTERM motif-containing protein